MTDLEVQFTKLHGAGNGYIVIDGRGLPHDWAALAPQMTDPHFGIGSDGLAIVQESDRAEVRMRIFNSDGSESEMSGNGIRLFAKFVLDRGIVSPGSAPLRIETGGGVRTLEPVMRDGVMTAARVAMGKPTFAPREIPTRAKAPLIEFPLDLAGKRFKITCLGIGNPHAVAILDEDIADFPLHEIGPLVQNHEMFPNRINFEIVNIEGWNDLRVRVFERGEGETASSGTGSTASMIAVRSVERCGDDVHVHLTGGTLQVGWPGRGEAFLTGPAVEVFSGVWRGPRDQNSIG